MNRQPILTNGSLDMAHVRLKGLNRTRKRLC